MNVLEGLIHNALNMQGEFILLEERDEYVQAIIRHKEGVSFERASLSIHNALEREMNRINAKDGLLTTRINDVPVQIVRIDQRRWSIRLFYKEGVCGIEEMGLSKIHMKAIRLMESLPYGVRFICSPNRKLATQMMRSLLSDEVRRFKNKIIVVVDAQDALSVCDDCQDNVIHLSMDADVFNRVRRIRPDIIFIEEPDTLDRRQFMQGVFELTLSGIQVWCSVTSNSVANVIYQISLSDISFNLLDMQVISGIVALKSAPRLCPKCAIPFEVRSQEMMSLRKDDYEQYMAFVRFGKAFGERVDQLRFRNPEGCDYCHHDGYDGDLILAEVLVTDPAFFQDLREGNLIKLRKHLEEQGFMDMHVFAKERVVNGELDPFDAEEAVGPVVMDEILLDSKIMMDRELEHV